MRILYVSQTGMTEPLGQSQVLAYLEGLTRRGADIEIISFEPAATSAATVQAMRERLGDAKLAWSPLVRSPSHAFSRKIYESSAGFVRAMQRAIVRRPDIVHARSYVAAAMADAVASAVPGARLLFDCRGMLGDEYVDAGHWTRDRIEYRLLKRYERRAFHSPGVVVLTDALRRWLTEERYFGARTHVEVVPCCVDTQRFRPSTEHRQKTRERLGLGDRLIVVYSGTLGSWYLENEMAAFVGRIRRARPDVAFLVLTRADTTGLRAACRAEGLPDDALRVEAVRPEEMHAVLPAGDLGLCFIRTCFSKIGSSPTKVAEYLAAGMPAVVNAGIGDLSDLSSESGAAVVLPDLSTASIEKAAGAALELAIQPYATRSAHCFAVSDARFGLDAVGLVRYERLYRALAA